MKEIKDFYNELGEDFLKKLLDSEIKVSEKLTGTKFGFRKVDGELEFYGRDKRYPLNKIDRTITSLYEKPIEHIKSLKLDKYQKMFISSLSISTTLNPYLSDMKIYQRMV